MLRLVLVCITAIRMHGTAVQLLIRIGWRIHRRICRMGAIGVFTLGLLVNCIWELEFSLEILFTTVAIHIRL